MKATKNKNSKSSKVKDVFDLKIRYNKNNAVKEIVASISDFSKKEINGILERNSIELNSISSDKEPSIVVNNSTFCWYKNGKIERTDGPAIISDNIKSFCLNGNIVDDIEFAKKTNHQLCTFCQKFCKQECFNSKSLIEETQLSFDSFFEEQLKKEISNLSYEELNKLKQNLKEIWSLSTKDKDFVTIKH